MVGWFDRAVPAPVRAWLDLYTRWVEGLRTERSFAMGLVRQWAWQIALNLILVAGIFVGAASLRRYGLQWWPEIPRGEDGVKAALWLGAMLLSLPLLIALFRKLRALCMLLSEMSVTRRAGGENVSALRSIVANTILAAASRRPDAPSRSSQLRHSALLEIAGRAGLDRHRDGGSPAALFHKLYSKASLPCRKRSPNRPPPIANLPRIPCRRSCAKPQLRTVRVPENRRRRRENDWRARLAHPDRREHRRNPAR